MAAFVSVQSAREVEAVKWHARKLTDVAEKEGQTDEVADAIYEFIRWLEGDNDQHPMESFLGELDDDEPDD